MAQGGRVGVVFMDSCDANKMGGGLRAGTRIPRTLGPALEFYMGATLALDLPLIFWRGGTNFFAGGASFCCHSCARGTKKLDFWSRKSLRKPKPIFKTNVFY